MMPKSKLDKRLRKQAIRTTRSASRITRDVTQGKKIKKLAKQSKKQARKYI